MPTLKMDPIVIFYDEVMNELHNSDSLSLSLSPNPISISLSSVQQKEKIMSVTPTMAPMRVRAMVLLCSCSAIFFSTFPVPVVCSAGSRRSCGSVIFNFGDSNSDTGGLTAGLGYLLQQPEGRTFFHKPSGRLCDGRLVLDFLCESLRIGYMSPYMESLGSDFSNGANFAVTGSKTLPANEPFALAIQVRQFLRFKSRSLDLISQGRKGPVDLKGFENALYSIDIGQNDLADAFSGGLEYDHVVARIPSVIAQIKKAIQDLYASGGKFFWIHNTGPLGCLPQKLSLPRKDDSILDAYGCLIPYNNAAKEFNTQLSALCDHLNSELNATIVHTDIYSIKHDLITNHTAYGFGNPLMACCGYGGPPYNFDQRIPCGILGCQVCAEGSKNVNWDGIHYTEAANYFVASRILSTKYSKPRFEFDFFCSS